MTIFGWDASNYDWTRGPMDLGAARRDGVDIFTHKATEGTSTKHDRYGEAMRRARAAGIPFLGAYHVVRSPANAAAEVSYCLAYANAQTPWWVDHPGWFWQVDLERWPYDSVAASEGEQFADIIEQRTGRRAIIYASKGQYGDQLRGTSHPLWNANYPSSRAAGYRDLYPGDKGAGWAAYSGVTPAIWQYSSKATIGRQNTCDANAFRGTAADFARLIGAAPSTPALTGADVELADQINIPTYEAPAPGVGIVLPPTESQPIATVLGATYRRSYLTLHTVTTVLAILQAVAKKVDLDPDELQQIEARAKAGAAAAFEEHQADFIAALLAALPTAAVSGYTVDQVQAAVRAVFADAGQAGDAPTV